MMTILRLLAFALLLVACKHETIINKETKMIDFDDYEDDGDAGDSELGAVADSHKKGWQTSGQLTTDVFGTVISLQANFEDEPGSYTVQFGIVTPPTDPVTGKPISFNAFAIIEWSVEGQTIQRQVAVANGVSVSGTAQGVKVRMYDRSDPASNGGLQIPYTVSAQVTKGLRPTVNQPPTFVAFPISFFLPNPGDTATADVPLGAISLSTSFIPMLPPDAVNNYSKVEMLGPTGTITKVYDPYVEGSRFVPIPPNTTQVRFTNQNTPFGGNAMSVQFTFGIDG